MKRREFLKLSAVTGAASLIKSFDKFDLMAQENAASTANKDVDLVAVMGGEPAEMFRKGIEEFGGMSKFIKPGYKVVIKPNIGWDKSPEMAADTNPELVEEIIKQCFAAGAAQVTVFDNTCDNWKKCYKSSGIEDIVKKNGAIMAPADEISYYKEINLPNAVQLKSAHVHKAILECDVWLNVPILKTHGGAKMTVSMKNLMGIVWNRKYFHLHNLQQCIADICTLEKRPVLNIVDAYRVMKSNGPRGIGLNDVVTPKALFMSADMVAVDTAAVKFFKQIKELSLDDVSHIAKGEALQIGTTDIDKLNISRIKI